MGSGTRVTLPSPLAPALLAALLGPGVAAADEPAAGLVERVFLPVVEGPESGRIDWTASELAVSALSDRSRGAWKDRRMQEQDALDSLGPRVRELASLVRVTPELRARDLLAAGDAAATRLEDDLQEWKVSETRYHAAGGVEMAAELDLQAWLRPALAARAAPQPPTGDPGDATGLLVDARAVDFELSLAPTVRTADGRDVVALALVSAEVTRSRTPVLYVTDPADPAAWKRMGDNPVLTRATDVKAGALVLPADSPAGVDPRVAPLVAAGKVVIVVSPP